MSTRKNKASTTTRIMPDRTEAQRLALQQRRLLEAAADDQRELREQRFDKAIPKVKRRRNRFPGAEPWQWRPPRWMHNDDAGKLVIDQPPPPTGVKGARPGRGITKGARLGAPKQEAIVRVVERAEQLALPRNQVEVLGLQIAGFTRAEIADLLGITEDAVRGLLARGKQRLREHGDEA